MASLTKPQHQWLSKTAWLRHTYEDMLEYYKQQEIIRESLNLLGEAEDLFHRQRKVDFTTLRHYLTKKLKEVNDYIEECELDIEKEGEQLVERLKEKK